MSKQKHYSNYRVRVYTPRGWLGIGHDEMMRRSRELAAQVDRHCDGEGKAEIHFDVEYTCSHCGYGWETDNSGLPLCCNEAQKEHEAATRDGTND